MLLPYHIYDIFGIGAWQTVYAMLHQFFNDITNRNFFNRIFRFSQTNIFFSNHSFKCYIGINVPVLLASVAYTFVKFSGLALFCYNALTGVTPPKAEFSCKISSI